jgi:hypothetical protein
MRVTMTVCFSWEQEETPTKLFTSDPKDTQIWEDL